MTIRKTLSIRQSMLRVFFWCLKEQIGRNFWITRAVTDSMLSQTLAISTLFWPGDHSNCCEECVKTHFTPYLALISCKSCRKLSVRTTKKGFRGDSIFGWRSRWNSELINIRSIFSDPVFPYLLIFSECQSIPIAVAMLPSAAAFARRSKSARIAALSLGRSIPLSFAFSVAYRGIQGVLLGCRLVALYGVLVFPIVSRVFGLLGGQNFSINISKMICIYHKRKLLLTHGK